MDKMRDEFEQWLLRDIALESGEKHWLVARRKTGTDSYIQHDVQSQWEAWEAARSLDLERMATVERERDSWLTQLKQENKMRCDWQQRAEAAEAKLTELTGPPRKAKRAVYIGTQHAVKSASFWSTMRSEATDGDDTRQGPRTGASQPKRALPGCCKHGQLVAARCTECEQEEASEGRVSHLEGCHERHMATPTTCNCPCHITKPAHSVLDEWDAIPVSHEQAHEAVLSLVEEHFNNDKPRRRTQFSIPPRPEDTDILLCRYIKQQRSRCDAAAGQRF